jgi:hypothetical protein
MGVIGYDTKSATRHTAVKVNAPICASPDTSLHPLHFNSDDLLIKAWNPTNGQAELESLRWHWLAAAFGYILMNKAPTIRTRLTLAMSGYNHQLSSTHRAHQLDHRLRVPRAVPKA